MEWEEFEEVLDAARLSGDLIYIKYSVDDSEEFIEISPEEIDNETDIDEDGITIYSREKIILFKDMSEVKVARA